MPGFVAASSPGWTSKNDDLNVTWSVIIAMQRDTIAGAALAHEFEYRILRDEEIRWVQARWKIFRDDGGTARRVIGVVTDVTERKCAEEELRASEARFRVLIEMSSDWYWRTDEHLRFTHLSPDADQQALLPTDSALSQAGWGAWAAVLRAAQPEVPDDLRRGPLRRRPRALPRPRSRE